MTKKRLLPVVGLVASFACAVLFSLAIVAHDIHRYICSE